MGMVRARPIDAHPELVAGAASGRAHVRVRVVAVDSPCGKDPFGESVFAWASDVIHHLVSPILDDRCPDSPRERVEGLVPADLLPPAFTTLASPLHRVQDPVRVGDLVEDSGPLGAVAAT